MLGFITWTFDPELMNIGAVTVRWYGLMWAIGLMLGYYVEQKVYDHEKLPEGTMDKLFLVMVIATIIGARVGHCFFYKWDYFSEHLGEVPQIWKGGLSSHGGAFGILLALYFFSRHIHKSYIWVLDRIVLAVAICGCCIRCGNLFNHEIYGYPTTMPWAFSFMLHPLSEHTGMSEPSHPTQIYEMLYCLVTFAATMYLYWKTKAAKRPGLIFAVFLTGIFLTRFLLEFIKNPQEEFEAGMQLNVGQLLSLPFMIAAAVIMTPQARLWFFENYEIARSEEEKTTTGWKIKSLCVQMAPMWLLVVMPLALSLFLNRQGSEGNEGDTGTAKGVETAQERAQSGNPVRGLTEKEVVDYMSVTTFRSEQGNRLTVRGGCLQLQGQKISEPISVRETVSHNGYYVSARGQTPKIVYRYFLAKYDDQKAVLLNLKDQRGNYSAED